MQLTSAISMDMVPDNNIALLLFLDVLEYYCGGQKKHPYSKEVKKFWAIGYLLFHRRWLDFMGGMKNGGTDNEHAFVPDTKINFHTPDRKVLAEEIIINSHS